MAQAETATPKHTVILVHGIRTHANWYQRAKEVFSTVEDLRVEPIKYGRFDLLRFLIPGPWRRTPIDKTEAKILPILERCRAEGRSVTIIAHSNGTNVIAQLLKRNPVFKFDNFIMCGSVIDTDYDWELIRHKIRGKIINDYGVRDFWPAVARSITWGYGYSGTNGFGAPVEDRLHDTTHSAYFAPEFMREYWESFFRTGAVVSPQYGDRDIPSSPWWFTLLEFPWKWILPVAAIGIAVWSLYPGPEVAPEEGEPVAAEQPVVGQPRALYAYYEIDAARRPTTVEGELTVEGVSGQLPLFQEIRTGAILRALSAKNLRPEPTTNSGEQQLAAGACVRVVQGRRLARPLENGSSGGWLPVQRVECPGPGQADDPPAAAEQNEIAVFSSECDRNPAPPNGEELLRAIEDARIVNTDIWLRRAIAELGERERPGAAANPRILEYMATANPVLRSDEQPWNSQFVNFVMRRAGKTGTNSGRAQSWLSWGKDAVAEVGEAVVGSIVVARREGVPDGGFAGFYLGSAGDDSIRMLAGNVCREVSVVTVPQSRIVGYRLPSGWIGPAQ